MKKLLLLFYLGGCASPQTEKIDISDYKPGTASKPTVYMFSGKQCQTCKEAKSILEREAKTRGDKVVIVDADDPQMMKRLGYSSLPVFRFVKPGAPILIMKGWDKKRFLKAYNYFDDGPKAR